MLGFEGHRRSVPLGRPGGQAGNVMLLVGVVLVVSAVLMAGFAAIFVSGQIESERLAGCDYKLQEAVRLSSRLADELERSEVSVGGAVSRGEWSGARGSGASMEHTARQLRERIDQVRECRDDLAGRNGTSVADLEGLEGQWEALMVAPSFVAGNGWQGRSEFAQSGTYSHSCEAMDDFVAALREGVLEAAAGSGALRIADLDAAAAHLRGWGRSLINAESVVAAIRECAGGVGVYTDAIEAALASEQSAQAMAASRFKALRERQPRGTSQGTPP